jgi:integrase
MPTESHTIMDGKVHVYLRPKSKFWQCAVFLNGRNLRTSTRQDRLMLAIDFARDWYMERYADERLRRRGIPLPTPSEQDRGDVAAALARIPKNRRKIKPVPKGPTFREAGKAFIAEFNVITHGERNANYTAQKARHLDLYLLPFFGDRPIKQVTAGLISEYRVHRMTPPPQEAVGKIVPRKVGQQRRVYKRPARSTLHQEIVTLRQVMKTANRKGWIQAVPDMSAPYKSSGKVTHRAWFSPDEYKRFCSAAKERARNPLKERWRPECEQFYDYVLFMGNTGLRPDEASHLQYRDVSVVVDEDTAERILEIEVRGKRGVGYCKSLPTAVQPFQRLRKRNEPKPTDPIFGKVQRELLNAILDELDMKIDREGQQRTAYSLRHTYICMRLIEGADIYQLAKNCRTSVEMIEKFYASHIKNRLDASAINVRKGPSKSSKQRKEPSASKALANA